MKVHFRPPRPSFPPLKSHPARLTFPPFLHLNVNPQGSHPLLPTLNLTSRVSPPLLPSARISPHESRLRSNHASLLPSFPLLQSHLTRLPSSSPSLLSNLTLQFSLPLLHTSRISPQRSSRSHPLLSPPLVASSGISNPLPSFRFSNLTPHVSPPLLAFSRIITHTSPLPSFPSALILSPARWELCSTHPKTRGHSCSRKNVPRCPILHAAHLTLFSSSRHPPAACQISPTPPLCSDLRGKEAL